MSADPCRVESPWLTIREAAAYARLTPKTLRRAIARHELRCSGGGKGSTVLVREDWVDDWLVNRGERGESS